MRPHWLDPAKLTGAGPKAGAPEAPPPPRTTVQRTGGIVVVNYDAPPDATALAVALRPKGSDEPAVTKAFPLDTATGQVEIPADDRDYRQRRLVLDAQRPRRVHARAQQKGLVGPGAVEKSGERVHGRRLDDHVCICAS